MTEFLGTEDTILFPSCMDANAGVFEAVLGEQDVMIADRWTVPPLVAASAEAEAFWFRLHDILTKALDAKLEDVSRWQLRRFIRELAEAQRKTAEIFEMDAKGLAEKAKLPDHF